MSWEQMNIEELEREYSPSSCIDDIQVYIDGYIHLSKEAEALGPVIKDIAFGERPDERLDLFPSEQKNAPLLVFIHGGYWQELSKNESTFAGPGFVRQGVSYAAVNYTIAPAGTLEQMVDQCSRCISWLYENAEAYGCAKDNIILAGHSAGAHLAVMAMIRLLEKFPCPLVKCGVLISGVYDLRPLLRTYVNAPLKLDETRARHLSPMFADLSGIPPAIVCWGENEPSEFKRQSQEFSAALEAAGRTARCFEVTGCNHFDIVHTMEHPATQLGGAIAEATAR
ncbi:MAG: alpha/beta hydrolase [Gemmatimonadota bacterium]|nr:alpha/beta hydrolase [Gemmatimonadota bacterium]